ncbi:uncharacterized protein LOC116338033 [Contarinia nasturtii]|uniref:uncharacterized protein LOC116338033 n=1 Tax=Contarinia nasturtii TaxID=265458 RepID=UPI0012D49B9E|nr:uncharacterized protein LOC116338033 [Contarinia nasturtii]XP_031618929.1 uncharacterized protein LOC116338033 [Contarinia nasturtii]
MLRPFKSFLNNLQKNAETFFGSKNNLPDMNSNEDEEEIATDSMYSIDELDPLADPLALDDELGEVGTSYATRNANLSDLDSSDDGQIILVDVNSLKNSFTIPVTYADNTIEIATSTSNVSATTRREPTVNELNCETNATHDVGIGDVSFDQIGLTLDDEITEEVEGSRSDGSDSGLGLELCAGLLADKTSASPNGAVCPSRSNLKRRSHPSDHIDVVDAPKKLKRNIQFTDVTVFYFPRIQGFTCVPSQGGCTLGMTSKHIDEKSFTLNEHIAEQKRIHRQQMLERSPRPPSSLSTSSLNALLPNSVLMTPSQLQNQLTVPTATATTTLTTTTTTTSTDDRSRSSTEESDSEEDILSDNSSSELDTETIGFLQPVSQKQRRALLKAAGVHEIASSEKNECRDIRASREICGCSCRDYCDPETCLCSQSGIKCQVDRASFPCGCSTDGCGNVYGRLEFNPKRVRTHFIHTIMRLELEKKQKKSDKQNTLHTYDGRLRLRESDDGDSVIDSGGMNTRLITYNPANNILYPTTTMQSSSGVTINSHYTPNELDDTSRNCAVTSMAETPLDLHYAFRNDYTVDPTQASYSLMYPNSGYYTSSAATTFTDFNAMAISNQSSLIPSYTNYSTNIPYNGLINGPTTPTTPIPNGPNGISSCSNYGASTTDCVHNNGSLFDNHVTEDFLSINQTNATNVISKDCKNVVDQFDGKYNEYVNDITSVSAVDLNCLLNDDNLAAHQIDSVPSTSVDVVGTGATTTSSNDSHAYMRFESDYANKLNATHNYSLTDDSNVTADEKSNELFQKDSVLTT